MIRQPKSFTDPGWSEHPVLTPVGSPATPPQFTWVEPPFEADYEWMTSENGYGAEHPCQHYRVHRGLHRGIWSFYNSDGYSWPYPHYRKWEGTSAHAHYGLCYQPRHSNNYGNGPYGHIHNPISGLVPLFDVTVPNWPCLEPEGYVDLKATALASMLPGIRPRLSLINSIIELKDFKSLAKQIPRLTRSLRNFAYAVRHTRIPIPRLLELHIRGSLPSGRLSLRRIVGGSANQYLQYMFAFRPLLSDIAAVKAAIRSTQQEINNLLEREGLPQKHFFQRSLRETYTDSAEEYLTPDLLSMTIWGRAKYWRTCTYTNPVFHSTVRYRYDLDAWSAEHAQLNGYLDALGIRLDPSIIWNAIPWSFVVDWVAGIGQWLSTMRGSNLEPSTLITGCTSSFKIHRLIETAFQLSMGYGGPQGNKASILAQTETVFRRDIPTREDFERSVLLSGLSLRELSLAVALGVSRR